MKIADTVIFGNFFTVEKKNPKAEAVAIKDGIFIYVGNAEGVKDYIGENTEVVKNDSGMILPGFGEGHGHISVGGTKDLFQVNLFAGKTLEDYRTLIKEHIEKHPNFEVIQGMGFTDFTPNGPTADMLEGLTDKYIVVADAGQHSYWVNHDVMKKLGIDKNTPDVSDGIIVRDENGNPTGWFREGAMNLIKSLTALLQAEGHDTIAEIEYAAKLRERTKGRMFDLSNIKVFGDGVIGGNPPTAYTKEPYSDSLSQKNNYCGQLRFDLETLTAVYKRSHELGFTVHVHGIADGALAFTLDAIEKALAQTGPHDFRDAVTHLQVVDKADIPRMAKLGVVACTDPFWFTMEKSYFDVMVDILGEERAENQLPMKSFFDAGVVVSSASDYPVENPAYPLIGIQKGVLRQYPGQPDTLHAPEERVTVEQMIEASTLNEAYQLLCDDRLGSITVGKEADLVILDSDITACKPENIADAKVLKTMVGGEWVYTCAV